MKSRKHARPSWHELCHERREDDGINPRDLRKSRNPSTPHQLGPLCKQAARCLRLALAGCADDALRDLMVLRVAPAPDASRLRVQVCRFSASAEGDEALVESRLVRLEGYLRAQIAEAVIRKRVPSLVFELVPTPGGGP